MTETLALPIQLMRNKNATLIIPLMLVGNIVTAIVTYYILGTVQHAEPIVQTIAPAALVFMSIPACVFLAVMLSPATIDISRTSVTITPLPIMGFTRGQPENRSISEFESIDVRKIQGSEGGSVTRIFLHGKQGHTDIKCEAPKNAGVHKFAQELGAALDLKVNDDA